MAVAVTIVVPAAVTTVFAIGFVGVVIEEEILAGKLEVVKAIVETEV